MSFRISSLINVSGGASRLFNGSYNSSPSPYVCKYWASDWIELLLKKVALNKLGPTVTTRWLLLAANGIYNSYQFVLSNKSPVDTGYWTSTQKGVLTTSDSYTESFVELACQYFIPKMIREYMNLTISPLTDNEVNTVVSSHTPLVSVNQTSLNTLKGLLNNYLSARDSDGWKLTSVFDGTLPNGDNTISADNSQDQDLNSLPEPNKWTPLKFGSTKKNYLTPEWGTKNKGLLNDPDFLSLLTDTNKFFPSDIQYENEMKEVSNITSQLTDEQKITAEFWAGGTGTVTPPGMWIVFLDIVLRSNNASLYDEIKSYTVLASALYQAGICAWRLKRDHLQARPIQKIRQYEYGNAISESWNTQTLGQYWLPYQELNFVTPPFPDFVSGHSTFSAASAKVFSYLFGTDSVKLINPVINNEILQYLSPVLNNNTANLKLNDVYVLNGASTIQTGVVPDRTINLNWNSWKDMANSSGTSRIYGGIHVESSNQAGLYLGSLIGHSIWLSLKDI